MVKNNERNRFRSQNLFIVSKKFGVPTRVSSITQIF